jgi:hypothetical protein
MLINRFQGIAGQARNDKLNIINLIFKQMKRIFFLMLTFFVLSATSMNAQVTIGSDQDPRDGAVLDLSQVSGKNLGLLLPHVSLEKTDEWQLSGSSEHGVGMLIYNINESLEGGPGLYVWNGTTWNPVKSTSGISASVPVTDFTVTPYHPEAVEIWEGVNQVFTVSNYLPTNAIYQAVIWDIVEGDDVIELNSTAIDCIVRGLQPGNAQLRVTSMDQKTSKTIHIIVKEVTITGFSLDKSTLSLLTSSSPGTITAGNFTESGGTAIGLTVNWSIIDGAYRQMPVQALLATLIPLLRVQMRVRLSFGRVSATLLKIVQ